MKYDVDLEKPPAIAESIWTVRKRAHGQRFTVAGVTPVTRKDGTPSHSVTWRSECAKCGEPFEITTGLRAQTLTRRCPEHRPGRRKADQAEPATPPVTGPAAPAAPLRLPITLTLTITITRLEKPHDTDHHSRDRRFRTRPLSGSPSNPGRI